MERERDKQTQKKQRNKLPEHYLRNGGPGRPKGSKNKFTQLKEDIVDLWTEEGGKDKLRALIANDRKFFEVLTKAVIPILPKDPLIDQSTNITSVTYGWKQPEDRDRLPSADVSNGSTRTSSEV